jgi:adhesin transport system outer membrane protein
MVVYKFSPRGLVEHFWLGLGRKCHGLFFAFFVLMGCSAGIDTKGPEEASPNEADSVEQADRRGRPSFLPFRPATRIGDLVDQLDHAAVKRSAAVQDVRAAEAGLQAAKYNRYPRLVPTGSAPLTGDGEAGFGLSIEQRIWDGGRLRAQLTQNELNVADAGLRAWAERAGMVQEGLVSYTALSRFFARLAVYGDLQKDLQALDERLLARAEGGVADRGERLRMRVALQEVQRAIIRDQSSLRQARADLVRALLDVAPPPPPVSLEDAVSACQRDWPATVAPADALAAVRLQQAEAAEALIRSRRFPRVVLEAGVSSLMSPTVGIKLDANDMLGTGRKRNLEAAEATTKAAEVTYQKQQQDTQAELARLEEVYSGYRADIVKIDSLVSANRETVKLFHEQVEAGTIPFTEGITIYQENAEADLSLIDLHANLLENCLRSAGLRGVLVPFGEENEYE